MQKHEQKEPLEKSYNYDKLMDFLQGQKDLNVLRCSLHAMYDMLVLQYKEIQKNQPDVLDPLSMLRAYGKRYDYVTDAGEAHSFTVGVDLLIDDQLIIV